MTYILANRKYWYVRIRRILRGTITNAWNSISNNINFGLQVNTDNKLTLLQIFVICQKIVLT